MTYVPDESRYERMLYRRCGRSSLDLPRHVARALVELRARPSVRERQGDRRAGVRPRDHPLRPGQQLRPAVRLGGGELRPDARRGPQAAPQRARDLDEGRVGHVAQAVREFGSRKYLLTSLDDSLERMGLDYVDIFYSHRFDPDTPLEETMGALASAVQRGKALYVGISSYSAAKTVEAAAILRDLGIRLLIHQPSYSMLNRWIEPELLDVLGEEGIGCICFSPLAQGMLTGKYLNGIPEGSRASRDYSLTKDLLTDEALDKIRALNDLAAGRGQTLAQMALAWTLPRLACHLDTHRREQRRPARGERRCAPPPRLHGRRARRDRPPRDRQRHQHLGVLERD